jgi:hypothetical protein
MSDYGPGLRPAASQLPRYYSQAYPPGNQEALLAAGRNLARC